jgi:hypothetical protein
MERTWLTSEMNRLLKVSCSVIFWDGFDIVEQCGGPRRLLGLIFGKLEKIAVLENC